MRNHTPSQKLREFTGAVTGPTEAVIEFMGLAPQHNEHVKACRWHLHVQALDLPARAASVREVADRIIADALARRNGDSAMEAA